MDRPPKQVELERRGDVFCVRLRKQSMEEEDLHEFGDEVTRMIQEDGCRKMVLSLGPDGPICLYSIFLAKLVSVQRRLQQAGGAFKLAHVSPDIFKIFEACKLQDLFEFCPDEATAIAELAG
jgi:anti-anti-sigma factor